MSLGEVAMKIKSINEIGLYEGIMLLNDLSMPCLGGWDWGGHSYIHTENNNNDNGHTVDGRNICTYFAPPNWWMHAIFGKMDELPMNLK